MAVPLSPTSPAPLSPTSSSLTELPTLSAPLFLPTHHTPHAPLPALPGAYALWLVPDAPEKLSSRAEELGYQVFPVPHVALTPWMGVEGEKDGEADLLWKVDKVRIPRSNWAETN